MAFTPSRPRRVAFDWRSWLDTLFEERQPKPHAPLDLHGFSDHLQRDLGLLDGRNPIGPHR